MDERRQTPQMPAIHVHLDVERLIRELVDLTRTLVAENSAIKRELARIRIAVEVTRPGPATHFTMAFHGPFKE